MAGDDDTYRYSLEHPHPANFTDNDHLRGYDRAPVEESRNGDDIENHQRPAGHHPVRRISQIINPPPVPPTLSNSAQRGPPAIQTATSQPFRSFELPRHNGCRYKCLEPVMPLLEDIVEAKTACDLLEFYFAEPDSALFRHASPYVLSPVIRKHSLLHATNPRRTTSALLVTILWTCAQTCDLPLLLLPGRRGQVCEKLRLLAMSLVHERDREHWHRALGKCMVSSKRSS